MAFASQEFRQTSDVECAAWAKSFAERRRFALMSRAILPTRTAIASARQIRLANGDRVMPTLQVSVFNPDH
jgi:hypothetical protein